MHTNLFNILWFSCQGKSRDVVYQCICLFLWLIFAQHGLFEIQLTVYSALSRLTDLGIYDISRCGIWLLTIFHITYIHFQRELRKVTSPKWYLSFFVQYFTCYIHVFKIVTEKPKINQCRIYRQCFVLPGYTNNHAFPTEFTCQTPMSPTPILWESVLTLTYLNRDIGSAVAEWLSSWLAGQEDRGSIPGLDTWIFRDWLSPVSKSRYAKS